MRRNLLVRKIGRWLYWLLPVILIWLILHRIDLERIKQNLTNLDLFWMFLAVPLYPLSIFLGAVRWHGLLNRFTRASIPLGFAVIQHWAGYAVGLFTPGYSGWDAYRVYRGGKAVRAYRSGLMIILLERLTALVSAMIILLIGAGFLYRENKENISVIAACGVFLLAVSIAGLGLLYWENGRMFQFLVGWLKRKFGRESKEKSAKNTPIPVRAALHVRGLLVLFGLSFTIQSVTVLVNYFLFHAIHNPLPLSVIAFATPASLLITMLPLSFGSVGVREFTFMYLYGLFGVHPEKAVLVAFFNLLGLLLNGMIGAVIFGICAGRAGKNNSSNSEEVSRENSI